MDIPPLPLAVRLIGFPAWEADILEANFAVESGGQYAYFCLAQGSLQDPDLYLVNADDIKALAILSDSHPSVIRPALIIGTPDIALPYPHVPRPIPCRKLYATLGQLLEQRASALSELEALGVLSIPERRRSHRPDFDLTDPVSYQRMRHQLPRRGGVLVIDKNPFSRDLVAEILARHQVPVDWAGDETAALALCERHQVAMVMINTSIPSVNPYLLCEAIKKSKGMEKITVIFLTGKPFIYDHKLARHLGCDGFLNKPLTAGLLLSTVQKFMLLQD
jgi:CheY-like chemotaxis protein